MMMVSLLAYLGIGYLVYQIFVGLFKPLSRKHKKKVRDIITEEKRQQKKEKLYYLKDVLIRKVSKKIFLSENSRFEYESLIYRLHLNTTPEEIRALQVLLFVALFVVAIGVFSINSVIGVLCFIAPVLGWMYPLDDMERKVERKNQNIMSDFPAFYSVLYYQYSRSVHIYLADVVKDFLPNANEDMARELEVFLDNIEYGEENALKKFKKRIPLRHVIKFCDIMQTRLNGYDNTSQMGYLKSELDSIRLERLEQELCRRERKNIQTQFILLGVLAVYVVSYFYFQFMDAIQLFS